MIAFWNGSRLFLWDTQGNAVSYPQPLRTDQDDADVPTPELEGVDPHPDMLLWPAEQLLIRPFLLPLSHPRLLDEEIIGQELAEQAGIDPASWWLCWQAASVNEGVAGLAFGMPAALRDRLVTDDVWRHCEHIGVDAWLRLAPLAPHARETGYAVFDADADGIFMGVCRDGAWRGMRRLNLTKGSSRALIAEDARRSAVAMGFVPDAMPAFGRLDAAWREELAPGIENWQGEVVDALPDRITATCRASLHAGDDAGPNFRRGPWAVRSNWRGVVPLWRRSIALAALLLLLVMGNDVFLLHRLRAERASLQTGIETVFHKALPDEKVMLDPLAQLRMAAGDGSTADRWFLLRQLESLEAVKRKIRGLHIDGLEYAEGAMKMFGTVPNLATVDRMRDILSGSLGRPVRIEDTELAGKQVRFRLKWS